MCLWCEVEERVYRSYEAQESKALAELEKIEQECPAEIGGEECADRPRCVWEKKLEFVMARMQKERLAAEVAASERCGTGGRRRGSPRVPEPTVPAHLLLAFERYIETMFDRLAIRRGAGVAARRGRRKVVRFSSPAPPTR
jgi:hypothetical protein